MILGHLSIVDRGKWFESRQILKEQTKVPRFMLEGPQLYPIFSFAFVHYASVK